MPFKGVCGRPSQGCLFAHLKTYLIESRQSLKDIPSLDLDGPKHFGETAVFDVRDTDQPLEASANATGLDQHPSTNLRYSQMWYTRVLEQSQARFKKRKKKQSIRIQNCFRRNPCAVPTLTHFMLRHVDPNKNIRWSRTPPRPQVLQIELRLRDPARGIAA